MTHVLLYHDVVSRDSVDGTGFPGPLAARYKLEPEHFEAHLDAIADTGRAVALCGPTERPPVALTFDDGGASALLAAEALERRGWRGHFFITTGRIGAPGFLSAAGVAELAARGHDVGSHSHSHPRLMGRLARDELDAEWCQSREILAKVLGKPPITASVPGGFLSREVVASAAAAGYGTLMTSEPISRVGKEADMSVFGRYSIWATTEPGRAAAYAKGARGPRSRLLIEWRLKGAAKRVSPRVYQALRGVRARAR